MFSPPSRWRLRECLWIWRQVFSAGTFRLRRALVRRRRRSPTFFSVFELRLAVRGVRSTGAGPAVVLALAGATFASAVGMSFVRTVLLSPLPFEQPGRLAVIFSAIAPGSTERFNSSSWNDLEMYRNAADSFDVIAAQLGFPFNLVGDGQPQEVGGLRVTRGYFDLLGGVAGAGRLLSDDDYRGDAPLTVVLSDRLWRTRFGADVGVVGRTIRLEDLNLAASDPSGSAREYTVVGVSAREFWAPRFWNDAYRTAELWVPFREAHDMMAHDMGVMDVIGRLAPGASPASAQAELRALEVNTPGYTANDPPTTLVRGAEEQITQGTKGALWQLLFSAVLLVIVACTNTGVVLGARALARGPQFATLAALGAPARRLSGLVAAEAIVLAAVAATLGVIGAWLLLPLIVALTPVEVPRLDELVLRPMDVLWAVGITFATVLLCAAVPAWLRIRRWVMEPDLRRQNLPANGGRLLLAVQVALGAVLLFGASSSLRAFSELHDTPLGFDTDNRLVLGVAPPPSRYPDATARGQFVDAVLAGLRELPNVESAALAHNLPLDLAWSVELAVAESGDRADVYVGKRNAVSGDYHAALGVPVLAGRPIENCDTASSAPVVVLNRYAAESLFPDGAVGKQVEVGDTSRTIVGVVEDTAGSALGPAVFTAWVPIGQLSLGRYVVVIRSSAAAAGDVLESVRDVLATVDPRIPILQPRRLGDHVDRYLSRSRFVLAALAVLAAVAIIIVILGALGVAGVEATSRLREIAIRQAVGATRWRVLLQLVAWPAVYLVAGAAAGSYVAFLLMPSAVGGGVAVQTAGFAEVLVPALGVASATLLAAVMRFARATTVSPAELLRK